MGYVQWQAASMGSQYLKAIVPRVITDNLHEGAFYQGGTLELRVAHQTVLHDREHPSHILLPVILKG